jgi:hypothetical protein
MTLTGGCCCGAIRYEASGQPYHATLCHCTTCRRASGAPVVAWFSVRESAFRIVAGQPASFASSEHGRRRFCPRCGTQLTFRTSLAGDEIDITTASLDDPEAVPPVDQTWAVSRLSWMPADDRPAYAHGRQES